MTQIDHSYTLFTARVKSYVNCCFFFRAYGVFTSKPEKLRKAFTLITHTNALKRVSCEYFQNKHEKIITLTFSA